MKTSYALRIAWNIRSFNTSLLIATSKEKNAPRKKKFCFSKCQFKSYLGVAHSDYINQMTALTVITLLCVICTVGTVLCDQGLCYHSVNVIKLNNNLQSMLTLLYLLFVSISYTYCYNLVKIILVSKVIILSCIHCVPILNNSNCPNCVGKAFQ